MWKVKWEGELRFDYNYQLKNDRVKVMMLKKDTIFMYR